LTVMVNMFRVPERFGRTLPLEWSLELSFSFPPCFSC
jgi:hypothetical protein